LVTPVFIILGSASQYIPLDKTYSYFPVTLLFNLILLSPLLGKVLLYNTFYTALIRFVQFERGTRLRSWLRHCATSQMVAGSIPDGVIGIFH